MRSIDNKFFERSPGKMECQWLISCPCFDNAEGPTFLPTTFMPPKRVTLLWLRHWVRFFDRCWLVRLLLLARSDFCIRWNLVAKRSLKVHELRRVTASNGFS